MALVYCTSGVHWNVPLIGPVSLYNRDPTRWLEGMRLSYLVQLMGYTALGMPDTDRNADCPRRWCAVYPLPPMTVRGSVVLRSPALIWHTAELRR